MEKEQKKEQKFVKKVCAELGKTQKELSEYIGVHEDTVSKWSRGIVETPLWFIKMFELNLEIKKLKAENEEMKQVFNLIKKFTNE